MARQYFTEEDFTEEDTAAILDKKEQADS